MDIHIFLKMNSVLVCLEEHLLNNADVKSAKINKLSGCRIIFFGQMINPLMECKEDIKIIVWRCTVKFILVFTYLTLIKYYL
jgi:hypothetical protein